VSFIGQSKRYATRICKFTVPSGVSRLRPAPQAGLPHKRATKPIRLLLLLIFCIKNWPVEMASVPAVLLPGNRGDR
jgi:hypothetical protein